MVPDYTLGIRATLYKDTGADTGALLTLVVSSADLVLGTVSVFLTKQRKRAGRRRGSRQTELLCTGYSFSSSASASVASITKALPFLYISPIGILTALTSPFLTKISILSSLSPPHFHPSLRVERTILEGVVAVGTPGLEESKASTLRFIQADELTTSDWSHKSIGWYKLLSVEIISKGVVLSHSALLLTIA